MTSAKDKEHLCNSDQHHHDHPPSSLKSKTYSHPSSSLILQRYPPQGIAHHLFTSADIPTSSSQPLTITMNVGKNIKLNDKIKYIQFLNQQLKYQIRSIHLIQQTRCKLLYQFQKQQFDSNESSSISSSYYQYFIKKKNRNVSSSKFDSLFKELLILTGLSTEFASHSRKISLHSMNSFLYEVEPSVKEETLERLQKDIGQFNHLTDHYTKEYYLWKWMVLLNLFDQVQQFKIFFKEHILITFKNESRIPPVKPFIPQFQIQSLSSSHRLDASCICQSFLNYPTLDYINKDFID
ncbi:hypothetical protein PIROE2DRAFT_17175, partial [Piromyces sp. E2]